MAKSTPASDHELSAKQAQFVQEYLIDLNGTQAAIRAGYSAKTAAQISDSLLRRPHIKTAMQNAMAERVKRTQITQDDVLRELAKIGFSDIRRIVSWGPEAKRDPEDGETDYLPAVRLIPSNEIDDDTAGAISEVSEGREGLKVKLYDKRAALVDIGKHLGMFKNSMELTGPDGAPLGPVTLTVVIAGEQQDPSAASQAG